MVTPVRLPLVSGVEELLIVVADSGMGIVLGDPGAVAKLLLAVVATEILAIFNDSNVVRSALSPTCVWIVEIFSSG